LREFTQALEKSAGDSLRRRAAAILGETDAVAREQRDLQYRLSFTLREIETLRGQLDRAEREARQDPLTGIGNRAQFDGTLQGALLRAGREDQPLSLLMLDMDHFKRFNERHGPAIGDQVLKLVAHLLTQTARENGGEAARFGGEAFALLLRGCALPRASQIADRLRLQVAGKTVRNRRTGEIFGQVTLSIGVAFYRPGESAAQLVNRADEAVYLAKAEGRNRVVTDDHPGLAP